MLSVENMRMMLILRNLVTVMAVLSFIFPIGMTLYANSSTWFGVGAGMLAIFAVLTLFCDYFSMLGIGGEKTRPDPYARPRAGIIAIASGVFWVISAWPES